MELLFGHEPEICVFVGLERVKYESFFEARHVKGFVYIVNNRNLFFGPAIRE